MCSVHPSLELLTRVFLSRRHTEMWLRTAAAGLVVFLLATLTRADGPADNLAATVRRVPKLGVEVSAPDRKELEEGLADLSASIDKLRNRHDAKTDELLPDVTIFHRAVHDALKYQEFFVPQ